MKDASVSVLYVLKKNAKTVKNGLEDEQHRHVWIDKRYRMTAAEASGFCVTPAEEEENISHQDCLAIPVLPAYFEDTNNHQEWKDLVIGDGRQACPFSTSVLGNPQKRHAMSSSIDQEDKTNANNNTANSVNSNSDEWSPLRQAMLQAVQNCFDEWCADGSGDPSEISHDWKSCILSLNKSICPSRLEVLGDDKNLVLPPGALLEKDLMPWLEKAWQHRQKPFTEQQMSAFMVQVWKQLTIIYDPCPRILRKGGVDPDSRIRQTGYQLLWPPATAAETATITAPQSSPGWITVTEQGIRQSFDVTQVMFSRGNITEKIRFGTRLVQEGDVVLDLYAGIGYYTLPALVKGKAAHVYACEWNPKALQALQYNLKDNKVSHKATVIAGDSRDLVLPSTRTTTTTSTTDIRPINRISLGLLPSSEGSWNIAIQALIGTLPKEPTAGEDATSPRLVASAGGWLHVHANVPVKERENWSQWLCHILYQHILSELGKINSSSLEGTDWVVICHHVEKVKSFAPTVNHYVADVFVGPRTIARNSFHPQHHQQQQEDTFYQHHLDESANTQHCFAYDSTTGKLSEVPSNVSPPSCALSTDGVLHQEWMMSKTP